MNEAEAEAIRTIEHNLHYLNQMFPPFTPGIKSFRLDYEKDELHLKGEKTILSMPLSKVLEYFLNKRVTNEQEKEEKS